jgi:hypothetical protein
LTRLPMPLSFADVDRMFLGDLGYGNIDQARRALRTRLARDLGPEMGPLRAAVAKGSIAPGFVVGPATATLPLALAGQLRDARGTWSSVTDFEKMRDDAAVTPSPYGRIFGTAPITAAEINGFFATIDGAQWKQLRSDPIGGAYGDEVLYLGTLLDLLGDDLKATEFAFVFANAHLGYLFAKLLPPPL